MSELSKNSALLGDAFLEAIRQAVREEVQAILRQNGNQEPKLLYNTKEAARILDMPESWLGSAARQGIVPCVRMGRYVRFTANNLESYIEKLRNETGQDMGAKRGSKRKRETD